MAKIKQLLINTLICTLSVFFGFVIIELLLSIQTRSETYVNSEDNFIKLELQPANIKKQVKAYYLFSKQADSFNERENYFLQTDKTGAIVNPKDRNTFYNEKNLKILFLGGSTTENLYIKDNKRFPALVSKFYNDSNFCINENCTILNAGVSGRIIPASINVLLNKYLVPRPEKVILMHNFNDLNYLLEGNNYWQSERHLISISKYPLFKLKTYFRTLPLFFPKTFNLILNSYYEYQNWSEKNKPKKQAKLIDKLPSDIEKSITNEFKKSLEIFISICKIQGIEPILMTQPSRFNDFTLEQKYISYLPGVSYREIGRLHTNFNQIIRSYKNKEIQIIDLENLISSSKDNMFDLLHLSEKGNQLAAEIIFKELTK